MVRRAFLNDGNARRQGMALWLLLLSILTHAVLPAGSPLQRTSGSAFSATTSEVAISPKRKAPGTGEAELSGADGGSLDGTGAGDDPPPLPGRAFPDASFASLAAPRFAAFAPAARGGAASFLARAPPSI